MMVPLKSRVAHFLNRDLDAIIPGADAIIHILVVVGSSLAVLGIMTQLITFMAPQITNLMTRVPNFDFKIVDGVETGNQAFLVFSVLRDVAFQLFILVFLLFAFLLIIKQAQLASNETMKKMLQGAVGGFILLIIFPYIWDGISDTAENSALSILNPLYSFDRDNPCVAPTEPREVLFLSHMTKIAEHSVPFNIPVDPNMICQPELLPNYLFKKALFGADLELKSAIPTDDNLWSELLVASAQVNVVLHGLYTSVFMGMTKLSMILFLVFMMVFISDMRYLLVDVIAISLPLLLVFRCIPFLGIDKLAGTLTSIFIPLLFAPIFASLIILAGATDLVIMEEDAQILDSHSDIENVNIDYFLFSLHAIATLSLVVMSPILFVPMLGSISSMMSRMTMTGIMTGVQGAVGMGSSVASGASAGFSAVKTGGSLSSMGALKSILRHPGDMGRVLGGALGGAKGGIGGVIRNDLAGASQMVGGKNLANALNSGKSGSTENMSSDGNSDGNSDNDESDGMRDNNGVLLENKPGSSTPLANTGESRGPLANWGSQGGSKKSGKTRSKPGE